MDLLTYRHKKHYLRTLVIPAVATIIMGWALIHQMDNGASDGMALLFVFIIVLNLVAVGKGIKNVWKPEPVIILDDAGITSKLKPLQPRTGDGRKLKVAKSWFIKARNSCFCS